MPIEQTPPPIERSYWIIPGRFAAGVYPGAQDPAEARTKLRAILQTGIKKFIDLTKSSPPRNDNLEPYAHLLDAVAVETGVRVHRLSFPITDMRVPTVVEMHTIQAALREALTNSEGVYLHCWGGRGRTGTVLGCWLVENGLSGGEALAEIRRMRSNMSEYDRFLPSPETDEQRLMVLEWETELRISSDRSYY